MTSLADIARATASEHEMFSPGVPVVVLVSGGADSMALLRLLAGGHLGEELRVSVLHVNHLLRGAESDADEAFVVEKCEALRVPCHTAQVDVATYAVQAGLNLEDAGRQVRYRLAAEEADVRAVEAGVDPHLARIAVGHTLDDRIETFLMRLLSGAGAGGLASMRHVRGRIVRPLLDVPRAEVRAWLSEQGAATWREDATNLDVSRSRARIRHELLPALLEIEPALHVTLARTMRVLADEDALLSNMAAVLARDFAVQVAGEDEVALDRARMLTLSSAMRRRTVRAALEERFAEAASRLESEHLDAISAGLAEDGFARDLPGGLRAFVEYDKMIISHRGERLPAVAPCLLPIPGVAELGSIGRIVAEVADPGDTAGDALSVVVDVGEATALTVGPSSPGERMRPLGMSGTKKLADLLGDEKIPLRQRPCVPVVKEGERVVWLAGVRMSDDYKVTPRTRAAVRLTLQAGEVFPCRLEQDGQES